MCPILTRSGNANMVITLDAEYYNFVICDCGAGDGVRYSQSF